MNEWEFTSTVASWINQLLDKNPDLPFSAARCEQHPTTSKKRRDLTMLDRSGQIALTGEVKLPYEKDGNSPYNHAVFEDARKKATAAAAPFFFTWNVNEFVLWDTKTAGAAWQKQSYRSWQVTLVHREEHLARASTEDEIKKWLAGFLHEFAKVVQGTATIGTKPPDESFVEKLESALQLPIVLSADRLESKYKESRFRSELDAWMRDEQGWIISDDPAAVRDNMERAAKFACYALVNKLVFYEALLKRYGAHIDRISVGEHIGTGEGLRNHLEHFFGAAKKATGDYETVFGEDHTAIGNRIPFYSDSAVVHWCQLIEQIHHFDFSKLDYEVVGSIFERLISPEERHKYGQFYTRVEVVDLINSFCIRTGREKVMDPGCGGGTFLVRAYARKRELAPAQTHGERLSDLYGVDISHFATHLTTINLATRDLIDEQNYPQIARSDFFEMRPYKSFCSVPGDRRKDARGMKVREPREVPIPALDAVIGNPPYIRQEQIPKSSPGKMERGTKEYYLQLIEEEQAVTLSGRSDIHCYFWPHAAGFLRSDGYLCFITSSQWLDVEYGFRLQEWILRNFEIVALLESIDEPWFVGARVATTVAVLRRQTDEAKRESNVVRFVQFQQPVREMLAHDGTIAGSVAAADNLRDEILGLTKDCITAGYRAKLVPQALLWAEGVHLGQLMAAVDGEEDERLPATGYYGGKWGVYIRAPELWFRALSRFGDRLVPLAHLATVRFGVKSGADSFFFPVDVTAECLAKQADNGDFKQEYGVERRAVAAGKVRLVKCGKSKGEIRPVEAEYLEPEVHSLMEVDAFVVPPECCSRQVLLTAKKPAHLRGTHVLEYIKWGEQLNYHKRSTCASRVSKDRTWYDLTGHARGALFWPMAQQYKHVVPSNDHNLLCNHNLFDVVPRAVDPDVLGGILNSTWVVLSKYQYGRPVGVEGNLKTEVVDVNMMRVPDPRSAPLADRARVSRAFAALKKRRPLQFLSEQRMRRMAYTQDEKASELAGLSDQSELDMQDRRELDDAVLEMLGVKTKKEREQLNRELYNYLGEFFEQTRQKEEKAIANKKRAARKGRAQPDEIAAQVMEQVQAEQPELIADYDMKFLDKTKPFDTFDLPTDGEPQCASTIFMPHGVAFMKGKKKLAEVATKYTAQDDLIVLLAQSGVRGLVRIPHAESECSALAAKYGAFVRRRDARLKELVEDRTSDEDMQEKILEAIQAMLHQ